MKVEVIWARRELPVGSSVDSKIAAEASALTELEGVVRGGGGTMLGEAEEMEWVGLPGEGGEPTTIQFGVVCRAVMPEGWSYPQAEAEPKAEDAFYRKVEAKMKAASKKKRR